VTVDRRALGEGMGRRSAPGGAGVHDGAVADVYRVTTEAGYEIKATEWHDFYTSRGKIKLKDLKPGDELLIQSGKGQFGGAGSEELGTLLGLITGDGHFTNRGKGEQAAIVNLWGLDRDYAQDVVGDDQCDDRGLAEKHATIRSVPSRT
jgi:ribonucleoside-diphosphate reductase alpha chain